jgi:hypothetical protein
MTIQRSFAIWCSVLLLPLLLPNYAAAQKKQSGSKYVCSEPNPQTMCNASNTCGSSSTPCNVEVKRTAKSASATPSIPNAKGNKPFCVTTGTTMTWQSSSKNTGFVVDFGPSSPFDPAGAIIGGSDRSVSVVAKKPGCYKFSAGACVSGAIYGMCASADSEIVITGGGN